VQSATTEVGITQGLREGWSLPSTWYADPHILEQEIEKIFEPSWQYAGHVSRLAEPGDYLTTVAGMTPIVVVRDHSGDLRAFVNVCTHRGHEVAQGHGRRGTLQCHYHAWTFNLDGSLRAAPRSENEPGFSPEELGLVPASVAQWGPLVFVNAQADAPPLATALESLPKQATGMGLHLDAYTHLHATRDYTVDYNWKVFVDNATECYHCPPVHRGFADRFSVTKGAVKVWPGSRNFAWSVPLKDKRERRGDDYQVYYMWPNFVILADKSTYYYLMRFDPVEPGVTRFIEEFYFTPDTSDEYRDIEVEFNFQALGEDHEAGVSVQRGLRSGRVARGRFLLSEERLLYQVQSAYCAEMGIT
jgi:choline monooxygenase